MSAAEAGDSSGGAYRQFNFLVHFGEAEVAGFADMSVLVDGGAATAEPESEFFLTLNRGVCGREFLSWLCAGGPRRKVSVRLLDEMRQPVMRWAFTQARPHQFAPPGSVAVRDAAPLETVRLAYRDVAAE